MLSRSRVFFLSALIVFGAAAMPTSGSSGVAGMPHKVHVLVLARSSSVHTSQSNQDVYLVEILPKHGSSFYGKVVDDFPSYDEGLAAQLAERAAPFTVELQRDSFCDLSAEFMSINGHLNAAELIASRSPGEEESTRAEPKMLRCFSAVHRTWKYEGPRVEAEWWR